MRIARRRIFARDWTREKKGLPYLPPAERSEEMNAQWHREDMAPEQIRPAQNALRLLAPLCAIQPRKEEKREVGALLPFRRQ
jgi:hypothetical protein